VVSEINGVLVIQMVTEKWIYVYPNDNGGSWYHMHLVVSRVTWHEYVTLVALGRCALLYGNWYLTLITIVNAWFKCYDSLIEMYIAFKNVLDAKIYDCWIIWEKIYVYLILVYEYYKCKCNFTLAFLLLVIYII
jgi:hypothetical protein